MRLRSHTSTREKAVARIALASLGSRGDLFRMLGLGRDLNAHGHRVTLFEYDEYAAEIEATGLRFGRIGPGSACHDALTAPDGSAMTLRQMVRDVALPRLAETVEAICAGPDRPDLVVAHEFQYAGPIGAEVLGVPFVSVIGRDIADLFYPPPDDPDPALRERILRVLERLATAELNVWRRRFGVPARADAATLGSLSDRAVVVMESRVFVPAVGHWPSHFQLSGYPAYHGKDHATVPDVVRAFVSRVDLGPLIICTLGDSWAGEYPPVCLHLARVAHRRGLRVLYLSCRGYVPPQGDRCLVYPFVPLGELLPAAAGIVHHAGRGTLMAALRAGVPSLLLPHWLDGFANARRVAELGAGRRLTEAMTEDEVDDEVGRILTDPRYRASAESAAVTIADDPDPGDILCDLADRLTEVGR